MIEESSPLKESTLNETTMNSPFLVLLCILGQTAAHAQLGGVPLWTNRCHGAGSGSDLAIAMAVDGSGNVFVTGSSYDTNGYPDFATIKYSNTGASLWTNYYNGPANGYDQAESVAVDGNGNVFVAGESDGGASSFDYATIKYSSAGTALWTNRYDRANYSDYGVAMVMDGSGNVFVMGTSGLLLYSGAGVPLWTNYDAVGSLMAVDGGGNLLLTGSSTTGGSGVDYVTHKYSAAGVPLWTNGYNGPGTYDDRPAAMAVDGSGNVFVTGSSPSQGVWYYQANAFATIKYSGDGAPLWTNRFQGPQNWDARANAIAVDAGGNVVVTGQSYGNGFVNSDFATIKYSPAGTVLWTNSYSATASGFDRALVVAVDASGNVFVAGNSYSTNGSSEFATLAYSGAGAPLWTNLYHGPGNGDDQVKALAVDGSGNVFVTGQSMGTNGYSEYVTIKYSAVPPSLTIARTATNTVAISWPAPSTGFTLQSTTNLASPVWSTNSSTPVVNAGRNTVIYPISGPQQFYRLVH
jgi:hypothetical protein